MTEQELLVDCLRRLNRTGLAYMLTGSMVSNYWGIPRTTHDIDFVVRLPKEEARRLVREFEGDFFIQEEAVREALRSTLQFNAIDTRSALKVDFWLLRGQAFDQEVFRPSSTRRSTGRRLWTPLPRRMGPRPRMRTALPSASR